MIGQVSTSPQIITTPLSLALYTTRRSTMVQGLFDIGVEKKENKVLLKMDSDLGFGQVGIRMEIRSFLENTKRVKRMGAGPAFTPMVRRNMKGSTK